MPGQLFHCERSSDFPLVPSRQKIANLPSYSMFFNVNLASTLSPNRTCI